MPFTSTGLLSSSLFSLSWIASFIPWSCSFATFSFLGSFRPCGCFATVYAAHWLSDPHITSIFLSHQNVVYHMPMLRVRVHPRRTISDGELIWTYLKFRRHAVNTGQILCPQTRSKTVLDRIGSGYHLRRLQWHSTQHVRREDWTDSSVYTRSR